MFNLLKTYEDFWFQTLDFKGRSTRKEYITINILVLALAATAYAGAAKLTSNHQTALNLCMIAIYMHIPPYIALGFRRFTDIGFNRWYSLCLYLPFVKFFAGLLCWIMPTKRNSNP